MKGAFTVLALVVLGLAATLALAADGPDCQHFDDSTPQFWPGYGWVCAGSGPGCTTCWDETTGAVCATEADVCIPGPFNRDL